MLKITTSQKSNETWQKIVILATTFFVGLNLLCLIAIPQPTSAATDCATYLYFKTPSGDQTTMGPTKPGTVNMGAKVEACTKNTNRFWRVTETKNNVYVPDDPVLAREIDNEAADYEDFSVNLTEEATYDFFLDYSEISKADLQGHFLNHVTIVVSKNAGAPGNTNTPSTNTNYGVGTVNYDASFGSLDSLINATSVPDFIAGILKAFFLAIGVFTLIMILVGAFRVVMSQGNSETLTKGKRTITWAIVGFVVALLSYSIVAILQSALGVQ